MPKEKKFPNSVLIYNPKSGSALDRDLWLGTIIDKICTHLKYSVAVHATTADITPAELLEDCLASEPELVIAAGGDGTIRHVLGSLSETDVAIPVGIVPFGTGNQLARNLKIYQDALFVDPLQRAVDIIAAGRTRSIDLGKMNGNYFCVAAGAGPLSDAILAPTREEKENWGMLAYVGSMLQTVASQPINFKITADGDVFQVKALGVIVTNVGDMGFATMSERARVDDGKLDLCIVTLAEFTDYVMLGFQVASAVLATSAPFYMRKVRSVKIESMNGPVTANVDGDACGTTPMQIEVIQKAVKVICP